MTTYEIFEEMKSEFLKSYSDIEKKMYKNIDIEAEREHIDLIRNHVEDMKRELFEAIVLRELIENGGVEL